MQLSPLDPRPSSRDVIMIELYSRNRFNSFLQGIGLRTEGRTWISVETGWISCPSYFRVNKSNISLDFRGLITWIFLIKKISFVSFTYIYVTYIYVTCIYVTYVVYLSRNSHKWERERNARDVDVTWTRGKLGKVHFRVESYRFIFTRKSLDWPEKSIHVIPELLISNLLRWD